MADLRYAVRLLRKSPLFSASVIVTVALGIGATTAIFSVVNAVLLRPLPFHDPDRLIQVSEKNDRLHLPQFGASLLNYLTWKEQTRTLVDLGAVQALTFTITSRGEPEQLSGSAVTASLMPVLGLQPAAGRGFTAADEKRGAAPVAMISRALWARRFNSDPGILGSALIISGVSYAIVGIAPQSLTLLNSGDIWIPQTIDPPKEKRLNHVLFVCGRLKPGVTMHQAQAEMDAIATRSQRTYPEMRDWGIALFTFTDTFVSPQLRTALLVLMGAVAFVLLIVAANVANLLLARAMERQKEIAVRAALGAGRPRILRQLLIESVVLSGVGGAIGVGLAVWGVALMEQTLPQGTLPVPDIGPDPTVLAFALLTTVTTGIVFGLAPAWHASKVDLGTTLKDAGRSSTGSIRGALRQALAGGELALATILLVGAGLLVKTLVQLERVPLGYEPSHVVTFEVSLPPISYDVPKQIGFFRQAITELRAIPGVVGAAVTSDVPFGAGLATQSPFAAPGHSLLPPDGSLPVDWRLVSPRYFSTLAIPLIEGRDFTEGDTTTAPLVVIVSQAAAKAFWGAEDPIGRILQRVADGRQYTVVGVVGDVRSRTLNDVTPSIYFSSNFRSFALMDFAVRVQADPSGVVAAARDRISRLDGQIPLANIRPLEEWISLSAAQPRLNAQLLALFAVVALLVAAIGTYGVLAYSVSRRTREFGLRMALGADPGGLIRLVVREGMVVSAIGIAAGLAGAAVLSRVLDAIVFGVSVRDPLTFAGVPMVLAIVAGLACVVPAVRASRVSPMVALRDD